jgi:MOSC domain-containing protein
VGRALAIGEDVRLRVALPDARCVMPSLAQEGIERDPRILKALARHNRIEVEGLRYPCAGVYAVADATGAIREDDHVTLA